MTAAQETVVVRPPSRGASELSKRKQPSLLPTPPLALRLKMPKKPCIVSSLGPPNLEMPYGVRAHGAMFPHAITISRTSNVIQSDVGKCVGRLYMILRPNGPDYSNNQFELEARKWQGSGTL